LHICRDVSTVPQKPATLNLHNGPWSTAGISMQAPASANSVLRSIPLDTALLLLWSIFETEM
jgi:hypothetical protein